MNKSESNKFNAYRQIQKVFKKQPVAVNNGNPRIQDGLIDSDETSDSDNEFKPYPNPELALKMMKNGVTQTASDIVDLLIDKLRKGEDVNVVKKQLADVLIITANRTKSAAVDQVIEKLNKEKL